MLARELASVGTFIQYIRKSSALKSSQLSSSAELWEPCSFCSSSGTDEPSMHECGGHGCPKQLVACCRPSLHCGHRASPQRLWTATQGCVRARQSQQGLAGAQALGCLAGRCELAHASCTGSHLSAFRGFFWHTYKPILWSSNCRRWAPACRQGSSQAL